MTGYNRRWYTLWIGTHAVYEDKPVYEDRKYDTTDIPGIDAMLVGWIEQLKLQEPGLVKNFVGWLNKQIAEATAVISRSQQELLDRYQAKLDEAHDRATRTRDASVAEWTPFLERARELRAALDRVCAPPVKEGGA